MTYIKPSNTLIYYGWLSGFNGAVNGWDNEKVAQDIARYELVVLGAGLADSSHGDYSNTSIIIPRVMELNPNCKIFGYVTTNMTQSNFEDQVDLWDAFSIYGIFMDEAGYDYGTVATNGRAAVNDKVDYVHGKNMFCFMNAWNIKHILGTDNDPSYPNSTWNSPTKASKLTGDDWYLLESFLVNTSAYTNDLATPSDWLARGNIAIDYREEYGINLCSANIVEDSLTEAQNLANMAYVSSIMWSLDGHSVSDVYYGASSGNCKLWSKPSVGIELPMSLSPVIENESGSSVIYWRYAKDGRFKLDFNTPTYSIDSY